MKTDRINLQMGRTLRFEPRFDGSPEKVWRLYGGEQAIRQLDLHEVDYIESAMQAATEAGDAIRRGHVVYSGLEAPAGPVDWSQADEERLDIAIGQRFGSDETTPSQDRRRVHQDIAEDIQRRFGQQAVPPLDAQGFQAEAGQLGRTHFVTGMTAAQVPGFLERWQETMSLDGQKAQILPSFLSIEQTFQQRVKPWTTLVFGVEVANDKVTRNYRFCEESVELVQAGGMTKEEVMQIVDYVFGRPVGELRQEVGGVAVTLASLCNAYEGLDMHKEGDRELARCMQPEVIEKIRMKQKTKPQRSPLPGSAE